MASKNNETLNKKSSGTLESKPSVLNLSSISNTDTSSELNHLTVKKEFRPNINSDETALSRQQTRQTIIEELYHRSTSIAQKYDEENEIIQKETNNHTNNPNNNQNILVENGLPTKKDGLEFSNIDPELVTWDGENDPKSPRNWSHQQKITIAFLITCFAFVSPLSSTVISPAIPAIAKEFQENSDLIKALYLSIFVLAWAIIPLFVSPLSEIYGRKIVLNISVWVMFAFNIGCAFSHNTTQIIIFRFLSGCGSAAPLSVGAGVLGDLFDSQERNFWFSLYSLGPTIGPTIGPVIAGYVVDALGWRWVFYILLIVNGLLGVFSVIFFRETYSPVLLERKARKLRNETGNKNFKTIYDITNTETAFGRFYVDMTRPLKLLTFHPMVIGLGSFMALIFGMLYILLSAFPSIWANVYNFEVGTTGLMFLSIGVGYLFGIPFWNAVNQKCYMRSITSNNGVIKPEYRIENLVWAGIIAPIGLIGFGWTAENHVHWIVPSIFVAFFGFAVVLMFQAIVNYLVDMNPRYAASAVGAAAVFRSVFGFSFPLFAPYMFKSKLSYGWSLTIFGIFGMVLGIPFPIFVYRNGEKLRNWANRRLEKDQAKRDEKNFKRLQKTKLKENEALKSDNNF
ncbi:MFS transporter [Ascoidea rubescens DSM 1968]|uniref:MFS general substrate transporter n=1 Tax=Ascoidea rubescens DSM 1968 TaxID=1344418 RepID=A0A1D2VE15_9ASCO|nr:MFS general substrate transporter [Ascoidea rubescens DSM 1968]ODV59891.1 MFS general substrate transporter [Ascoidea rubescens DSM 1968]